MCVLVSCLQLLYPSATVISSHYQGPSELSITDPAAVEAIYGTHSPTVKGPWYTLLEPRYPLFMARDKEEHARRRKVWDQGFSTKGRDLRHSITRSTFMGISLTRNPG
jgi:cytochrome P450